MTNTLNGKVAIVTGSGMGIGRAAAIALAAEGAKIVTNNRRPGSDKFRNFSEEEVLSWPKDKQEAFDNVFAQFGGDAETTARQIREGGGEAVSCFGDITEWSFGKKIVDCATLNFGTVDIVVNAAGVFRGGGVEDITDEVYDRCNNVKPRGYFSVIQAAAPLMKAKGWGRVINRVSKAWQGDGAKSTAYAACNAGAVGLTRGLAMELTKYGITVNAFTPHAANRTVHEMKFRGKPSHMPIPGMSAFGHDLPGNLEDAAPFLCWLCTDRAGKVSGSVFSVSENEISLHQEPFACASMHKPAEYGMWTQEEIETEARRLFLGYRSIVAPDIQL